MSKLVMGDWLSELRGSRPWTEQEARRVLDACAASGATVSAFARQAGLLPQRLYWWRERLGASTEKDSATSAVFLPMVVREAPVSGRSSATVWTRDGHRVEVTTLDGASAAWVAAVVRSLEGARS